MNTPKENGFPRPLSHRGILSKNQQPVWVIIAGTNGVLSSWALIDINTRAGEIRVILPSLNVYIAPLVNNSHYLFADMGILIFDQPVQSDGNPYIMYS